MDRSGVFYGEMSPSGPLYHSPNATIKTKGVVSGTLHVTEYYGPYGATNPTTLLAPGTAQGDLNEAGTTAIARCKPTNSVADVGTALGEVFREGFPKMLGVSSWKERASVPRAAGSEYLNSEFGWKPLVGEVQSIAYAAANSDRLLSQYERNSGRVVRRRYEFPVETSEETVLVGNSDGHTFHGGSLFPDSTKPAPKLYKTTRTYRRVWFSGAFTYYLPTGYGSRNALIDAKDKASILLGLDLNPDTLWNLAPWSWAVDWFSNTGDVISNLSDWATDGLVMRYGYIMEHSYSSVTYNLVGRGRYAPDYRLPAPVTAFTEVKRREEASPFGFGLTFDMLSPRQLAITAALGITRVFR